MNPLRSVGGRLALALLVVVGGALAIVYFIVVPSYQSSLIDARLHGLRETLQTIAAKPRDAPGEVFPSTAWIEDEALPRRAAAPGSSSIRPAPLLRAGRGLERRHLARRRARPDGPPGRRDAPAS